MARTVYSFSIHDIELGDLTPILAMAWMAAFGASILALPIAILALLVAPKTIVWMSAISVVAISIPLLLGGVVVLFQLRSAAAQPVALPFGANFHQLYRQLIRTTRTVSNRHLLRVVLTVGGVVVAYFAAKSIIAHDGVIDAISAVSFLAALVLFFAALRLSRASLIQFIYGTAMTALVAGVGVFGLWHGSVGYLEYLSNRYDTNSLTWFDLAWFFVLWPLIPIGLFCLALLLRYPLSFLLPSAVDATNNAAAAPIVFLRSFLDDGERVEEAGREERFERICVRSVRRFGPLIAVGEPKAARLLGAARSYYRGDTWRDAVIQWSRDAGYILLSWSDTPGITWELNSILANDDLHRKLIIVFRRGHADIHRRLALGASLASTLKNSSWGPALEKVDYRTVVCLHLASDGDLIVVRDEAERGTLAGRYRTALRACLAASCASQAQVR